MDFIYLLAYGAIFGIIGVASRFVPLFFGKGYAPVAPLLYSMVPLILIVGTSNCLGSLYYTPSGQRKRSAKVVVLGALINLCFNVLLIPGYGAQGATVASVIAEVIITVIYIAMSESYMTWKQIWLFSYERLIAGGVMLLAIRSMDAVLHTSAIVALLLQITVGALCYGAVLLLLHDTMMKDMLHMGVRFLRKMQRKLAH